MEHFADDPRGVGPAGERCGLWWHAPADWAEHGRQGSCKGGKPLDGEWLRAHKFITAYQKYAFKLQNADGSFSTQWLERRDASNDIQRRVQTTGHILEWLIFSLPEKELTDPRVVKSVNYLATLLSNNRSRRLGDRTAGPRPARPGALQRSSLW